MNEIKTLASTALHEEAVEVMDVLSTLNPAGRKTLLAFLIGAKFGMSVRQEQDSV